jgi:hypothetical protein
VSKNQGFPGVRNKWDGMVKKTRGLSLAGEIETLEIGDSLHLAVCFFHPTVSTWSVHYPHLLLRCLGVRQEFFLNFF